MHAAVNVCFITESVQYKCCRHGSVHGLCSIHCAVVFLAFVFMITSSFCGAIW